MSGATDRRCALWMRHVVGRPRHSAGGTVCAVLLFAASALHAQSGGPYRIRKSTIDGGGVTAIAGGEYTSSGTVGQPDATTIAGGAFVLYGGFWSPAFLTPDPVTAEAPAISRVRFISFVVPASAAGTQTALRVELASLHHPSNPPPGTPNFSAMEGEFLYVNSLFGGTLCVDSNSLLTYYRCGQLSCQPEYRGWAMDLSQTTSPPSPAGLIHVTGQAVVPSSTYHVSHLAAACGPAPGANLCATASAPLAVATSRWGDQGSGGGGPPDGSANVVDIGLVVDNVKGLATSLPEHRAWLKNPTNIAGVSVNVVDIGLAVDAVKGLAYPYGIVGCP